MISKLQLWLTKTSCVKVGNFLTFVSGASLAVEEFFSSNESFETTRLASRTHFITDPLANLRDKKNISQWNSKFSSKRRGYP